MGGGEAGAKEHRKTQATLTPSSLGKKIGRHRIDGLRGDYAKIAAAHARAQEDKARLSLAAARANALKLDWSGSYVPPKPSFLGSKVLADIPIGELVESIDWTPFFQTWELSGKFPAILDDAKFGEAARSLYDDAIEMLDKIMTEGWFTANAVAGFWPANAPTCIPKPRPTGATSTRSGYAAAMTKENGSPKH